MIMQSIGHLSIHVVFVITGREFKDGIELCIPCICPVCLTCLGYLSIIK